MKFRQLGAQGPVLSTLGYGTWEHGGRVDRPQRPLEECLSALDAVLEQGVNWIDSAETYGAGRAERIVGEACRSTEGAVFVASKLAPIPSSSGSGFEPWQVRWGLERTLTRLGRDQLDIFMLHWPDPHVDTRQTWEAMAKTVDDGLVRWIGLSNFPQDLTEQCHEIFPVACVEVEASLLRREHLELIEWCGAQGIGALTYGSLAYGILTGQRRSSPEDEASDYYAELFDDSSFRHNLAITDSLAEIANNRDCSAGQIALSWLLHQEGITSALFGSTNLSHIEENVAAADVELGDDDLRQITALLGSSPS